MIWPTPKTGPNSSSISARDSLSSLIELYSACCARCLAASSLLSRAFSARRSDQKIELWRTICLRASLASLARTTPNAGSPGASRPGGHSVRGAPPLSRAAPTCIRSRSRGVARPRRCRWRHRCAATESPPLRAKGRAATPEIFICLPGRARHCFASAKTFPDKWPGGAANEICGRKAAENLSSGSNLVKSRSLARSKLAVHFLD